MSIKKHQTVAEFKSHSNPEEAILVLNKAGFDVSKIRIVSSDYQKEEHVVGIYGAAERIKTWGKIGVFCGLVIGAGYFLIFDSGPAAIGALLLRMLARTAEGAVIVGGLSALGAMVYTPGISNGTAVKYETEVKANKFLIVLNGSEEEIENARKILLDKGIARMELRAKAKRRNSVRYDATLRDTSVWKRPF